MTQITGFSKLSKAEKLQWIAAHCFEDAETAVRELQGFWHPDAEQQRVLDSFSENTLSNFVLPFGVAPNFLINGRRYTVPMAIEESSVVAAAASAAKFWETRGGFRAEVLGTVKVGQVHFTWPGAPEALLARLPALKARLSAGAAAITANMEARGGGVLGIELLDLGHLEPDYFQLKVHFETCDSMGANFINSVLENYGQTLRHFVAEQADFAPAERELEVVMAILSNYTPECLVRASVSCPLAELGQFGELDGAGFAEKFARAVRIARLDPYRAATHNKGIFNGIDAVVIATGNDFRAVEACGHAFAARDGQYRSLSQCTVEDGVFRFWLDIPLALGTVGGLTKLHPLARRSLEMLGQPSAQELMAIVAATGLAQNFAALRSLVTTGIQQGHMKMHLLNILNHLGAKGEEVDKASAHFCHHTVSFSAVREFLHKLRGHSPDAATEQGKP